MNSEYGLWADHSPFYMSPETFLETVGPQLLFILFLFEAGPVNLPRWQATPAQVVCAGFLLLLLDICDLAFYLSMI